MYSISLILIELFYTLVGVLCAAVFVFCLLFVVSAECEVIDKKLGFSERSKEQGYFHTWIIPYLKSFIWKDNQEVKDNEC